jgi:CRP-like cAMP-binding protein
VTDFLAEKRAEIEQRLRELKEEQRALEAAAAALASVESGRSSAPRESSPRRRRRAPSGASTGRRRGRPRGSGTRGNQALALVQSRPGITIPELAEAMGIKQNYLYRVMPQLQEDGKVAKRGRGWHPVDPTGTPAAAGPDPAPAFETPGTPGAPA